MFFTKIFGRSDSFSDFEEQTLPFSELLYGSALRLTKDPSKAEDLVQETFLRAYRFWHRYEKGTNLKAWLLRIQTNEFINRYRKDKREKAVFDLNSFDLAVQKYADEEVEDLPPEVRTQFLSRLMGDEVVEALDALPIDFRMVVLLVDINDLSYKEVAEILECPVGTVMSRLHRARKMMRANLFEYAVEQGIIPPPAGLSDQVASMSAFRKRREGASS